MYNKSNVTKCYLWLCQEKSHQKAETNFSYTKWVERHTSPFDIKTFLTDLLDCFEVIWNSKGEDRKWERKSEANGFWHNISNPSFIVTLNYATFVSYFTSTVVNILKSSSMEIIWGYEAIRLNVKKLQAIGQKAFLKFHKILWKLKLWKKNVGKLLKQNVDLNS